MAWQSVIVGVDGSEESARAAGLAASIANRAGASCRLVHVISDYTSALSIPEMALDIKAINDAAEESARRLLDLSLGGQVSVGMRRALEIRTGRPAVVLADLAKRAGAEVVVLGGKHRERLARLAGSTVTNLVRLSTVPVLATADAVPATINRVLAAVDLSDAAAPTIRAAERWAVMLGAHLRIMHAAEPMQAVPGFYQQLDREQFYRTAQQKAEAQIGKLVSGPEEIVVRPGRAAAAIATEVKEWGADLVVVGSHGKGWVDRLLIGSTSERLVDLLPAAVLVVPTAPREALQAAGLDAHASPMPLSA